MKVSVVGGGPAGLYLAYLLTRHSRDYEVSIFERNPPDATFGFGVVFSNRALEFLHRDDDETYRYLKPHMEAWPELSIIHRDQCVSVDGNGFTAIGRLDLLNLLRARCEQHGVELNYSRTIRSVDELPHADLVVAADGANSFLRDSRRGQFGTSEHTLRNPFIWYGTNRLFDSLSLTFRENEDGVFCAHHYRYNPNMSTFIIETDAATFQKADFKGMSEGQTKAYCENLFRKDLNGYPLLSNKSCWRWFPQIRNERWVVDNIVLLGDALHTAHFSIGSGTRLAMEDAIALFRALLTHPGNRGQAMLEFEKIRRPTLEKLIEASISSARWYEQMADKMRTLPPYQFAHSYMTRTGRVSDDRLEKIAPGFMRRYREKTGH